MQKRLATMKRSPTLHRLFPQVGGARQSRFLKTLPRVIESRFWAERGRSRRWARAADIAVEEYRLFLKSHKCRE